VLRLSLPPDYPFSAPDFFVMTPNGRFAVNTKICTTFSSFHPETWTPSYTYAAAAAAAAAFAAAVCLCGRITTMWRVHFATM
jgi:hypothetical protein